MNEQHRLGRAIRIRVPVERINPPPQRDRAASRSEGIPENRRSLGEQNNAVDQGGVYVISVAARILQMHPQTLRKYERIGLVNPTRTMGMLRLYSEEDIAKLRLIKHFVEVIHLNLAGVELAISMVERLMAFRQRLSPHRTTRLTSLQKEIEEILTLVKGR